MGKPQASMMEARAGPADGVERLGEIELEDDRRSPAAEASLHELRRVDKIFRDASSGEEPRMIGVNEVADLLLKVDGERLAHSLDAAVLQ
jgi:hypothetical protein